MIRIHLSRAVFGVIQLYTYTTYRNGDMVCKEFLFSTPPQNWYVEFSVAHTVTSMEKINWIHKSQHNHIYLGSTLS